ncbi:MAG TPA: pyruvate:ferredoxin (flavodoxin) oxidoreductase [Ignavibacteriales bacterium]|nr:pyruvate:ferredoxin (flavodoxin) oxidoreductase [Ignavibacteriales bacterium]
MGRKKITVDGNEAAAYVAYRLSEVISIYPITPSSPMGEFSDDWSAKKVKNIWGTVPTVMEMQSEGGAAGAVHGALQAGTLSTTFTASQGLLLMIPNMYKIAGELTPTVFHVTARALAAAALSIFGDHSDVMSVRQTGFAMLASTSVQEVMDMALIAHASTLKSRVPFLHFFDGFRTSHEVSKIEALSEEDIKAMIDNEWVYEHKRRALNPDNPFIRGTAQNPDVYFQGRETVNKFYLATPAIVQEMMDKFAKIVGRQYNLFDYYGSPNAERVIVIIGSGAQTAEVTAKVLNEKYGYNVGVLVVRLFRPFSVEHFLKVLPKTVKKIAVLDRTKEPGSLGEPLYLDVTSAIAEGMNNGTLQFEKFPKIIGGRYGLGSKEFTPGMVKAIYDELAKDDPKNHFTVGIDDDVTNTSLSYDENFPLGIKTFRAMFYGLGADGTVGANKNTIKIIGEETDYYVQGYFVYDSKKSGSMTISHLRFGEEPIKAEFLIKEAEFVACHQFQFVERINVVENLQENGVFLLNSPYSVEETWKKLPKTIQQEIIKKKAKFYVIDAYEVAKNTGMGTRINTIMQTCFFAISGVLPKEQAIEKIKNAIKKTYSAKGEEVVKKNFAAVDHTLEHLHELKYEGLPISDFDLKPPVPEQAPEYVKETLGKMIAGYGDKVKVSEMPVDGTFPSATTQWEKRNIALDVPIWESDLCIQCGKCAFVCPHAAIRTKAYDKAVLANAPAEFKAVAAKGKEFDENTYYTVQVAPEDCTGCGLCVEACPAKDKSDASRKAINMQSVLDIKEREIKNYDFFLSIPEFDRSKISVNTIKGSQLLQPLFEYSGACAGCGETPYVKLVSQLFGDRLIVANATGCSSIYGGNLPTTPWSVNKEGRGPAWSNSLFEDNAEFGLGMRLAVDKNTEFAVELISHHKNSIGVELVEAILSNSQKTENEIQIQRENVAKLKEKISGISEQWAKDLLSVADYLVKKSVWIIGGDGWAYDIGYGGLDHVLASGKNVNILVLDTEVYSNTGGQASKSTPIGAVAKFAASGKPAMKKDLAMLAMTYQNVYVARVAMGANDLHTLKVFLEAEAYDGPSIIIAYSHCIAHGIDMAKGLEQQKLAVESGHWPLMRFNPDLMAEGKNPFVLDSKSPKVSLDNYIYRETRYKMLTKADPEHAKELLDKAQEMVNLKTKIYQNFGKLYENN